MLWTNTQCMHLRAFKGRLDKLTHTRVGSLRIN